MKKALRTLLCALVLVAMLLSLTACKDSYKVTVMDPYDFVIEDLKETYKKGETVTVKTVIAYDADIIVYVNETPIKDHTPIETDEEYARWEFYFEMPAEDVVLTFEVFGSK